MKRLAFLLLLLMPVLTHGQSPSSLPLPHEGILDLASSSNPKIVFVDTLIVENRSAEWIYSFVNQWVMEYAPRLETNFVIPLYNVGDNKSLRATQFYKSELKSTNHIIFEDRNSKRISFNCHIAYFKSEDAFEKDEQSGHHTLEVVAEAHDYSVRLQITHVYITTKEELKGYAGNGSYYNDTTWPIMQERKFYTRNGEKRPVFDEMEEQYLILARQFQLLKASIAGFIYANNIN